MSDGPFRDDQEAALARAAALDADLAREKSENDRLRAENARLRKRRTSAPPKPRAQPVVEAKVPRPASARAKLIVIGAIVMIVGVVCLIAWRTAHRRVASRESYDKAESDHQAQSQRWRAYITVEPAIHRAEQSTSQVRALDAATVDPRVHAMALSNTDLLTCRCDAEIDKLVHLPAPAGVAFSHWRDVEAKLTAVTRRVHDYWSKGDWKDDSYRSATERLAELDRVLDERAAVFVELRRDALPYVREQMRAMQAEHLARHGKDRTWWDIEIGFMLVDLVEAVHDKGLSSDVVESRLSTLQVAAKDAPPEVWRKVRDLQRSVSAIEYAEDALWIHTIGDAREPITPVPKRSDY